MTIKPGNIVRHIVTPQHEDSCWTGIVIETVRRERMGGDVETTVYVRWMGSDDDPSDGTQSHSEHELKVIQE